MFERTLSARPGMDAATVAAFACDLAQAALEPSRKTSVDEAGMVQEITALEDVKSAAAARQAQLTEALDRAVRDREAAAGVPAEQRGRGVAAQVALAAASPRSPVAGTSGSPRRWSGRCRTP